MNYKTDGNFHTDFLELLAKRMRPAVYVELGIAEAETIRRVAPHCRRAIGVDVRQPPKTAWNGAAFEFFKMTTNIFLRTHLPLFAISTPAELALIDADHSASAVELDLLALLPWMAEDGVIVLHDTYPESERYLGSQLCGDGWRTADSLRGRAVELGIEVATLPVPPGLTIVRKRGKHLRWMN